MGDSQENNRTQKILADLSKKLLDFTRKNSLIHLSHSTRSRTHIRVIDELPDQLYEVLKSDSSLQFKPLPDPEEDFKDEHTPDFISIFENAQKEDQDYIAELRELGQEPSQKALNNLEHKLKDRVRAKLGLPTIDRTKPFISEKEMAIALKLNPSYEMPLPDINNPPPEKHSDSFLQTLLYPLQLESKVSKLYEQVRLTEQETGINTLYCVFGFLEWYPDSNDKACTSPLLLFPLSIEREFIKGRTEFFLKGRDEEMLINLTLSERLKHDFGIIVPSFEENDTPESYFRKIQEVINSKKDWIIKRFITVGLFSFARQMMYLDLNSENWPKEASIAETPLLKELFSVTNVEKSNSISSEFSDVYNPDEAHVEAKVPVLIYDADSSQFSAIVDVMEGKNTVIEGPPGTGKSQTITNIIANAIYSGKSVLFVAEKKTALDIVKKRLEEAGLGDFCLELHSNKTNKKLFYESLKNRREFKPPRFSQATYNSHKEELNKLREQLNDYRALINTQYEHTGFPIHKILGKHHQLKSSNLSFPKNLELLYIDGISKLKEADLKQYQARLHAFEKAYNLIINSFGSENNHPWNIIRNSTLTVVDKDKVLYLLNEWLLILKGIDEHLSHFKSENELNIVLNLSVADSIISIFNTVKFFPDKELSPLIHVFSEQEIKNDFEDLITLKQKLKDLQEAINLTLIPNSTKPNKELLLEMSTLITSLELNNIKFSEIEIKKHEVEKDINYWEALDLPKLLHSVEFLMDLLPKVSSSSQKIKIEELIEKLNKYSLALAYILKYCDKDISCTDKANSLKLCEMLQSAAQKLGIANLETCFEPTMSLIYQMKDYLNSRVLKSEKVISLLKKIMPLISSNTSEFILSIINKLIKFYELLISIPSHSSYTETPGIWDEDAIKNFESISKNVSSLRQQKEKLLSSYRLTMIEDYDNVKVLSSALICSSGFDVFLAQLLPFTNKKLSSALRFFKQLDKNSSKSSPQKMGDELMEIYLYFKDLRKLNNDSILRTYGILFKELDTDFDNLASLHEWTQQIKNTFNSSFRFSDEIISILKFQEKEKVKIITEQLRDLKEAFEEFNSEQNKGASFNLKDLELNQSVNLEEYLSKAKEYENNINNLIQTANLLGINNKFNFKDIEVLREHFDAINSLETSINILQKNLSPELVELRNKEVAYLKKVINCFDLITSKKLPLKEELQLNTINELIKRYAELESAEYKYANQYKNCLELAGNNSSCIESYLLDSNESKRNQLISYVTKVQELTIKKELKDWLLSSQAETAYNKICFFANKLKDLMLDEQKKRDYIYDLTNFNIQTITDDYYHSVPITNITSALESALSSGDNFNEWLEYLHLKQDLIDSGCSPLLESFLSCYLDKPISNLSTAFEFIYFNILCKEILLKNPKLQRFSGITHEEARKRYQELDKKSQELERKLIAIYLDKKEVPEGKQSSIASEKTELTLIRREIEKKSKHVPIRELLQRACNACQQLKPCFMMSPLSVAQFLTPGKIKFDLVIMDEASQIKPEEAIGAIARGKQVVIVGDPKQLGPTNFFNRSLEIDEDELEEEEKHDIGHLESILDLSLDIFRPRRRLSWHYRSRHESLIQYSNKEFYNNDLLIFPSAINKHPDYGVQFIPLSNGLYRSGNGQSSGINIPEADLLIEHAISHMQQKSNQSLGIVAINKAQSELINQKLEHKIAQSQSAQKYLSSWEDTLEPLFIKNLESVQGDERDVIFISTVYGKDTNGNFYQRFGPINNAQGHRRLNVLFTRAKNKIIVFSSMTPDMVKVESGTHRGVRVLKEYLTFAQLDQLPQNSTVNEEPKSDFSVFVGKRLEDYGYEVDLEVGVSGFFIDIAVKHPKRAGAYLLGIECDGQTYHSSKSARDRDRLRQSCLENLNWKIYRIWSTDWFKNPHQEMKKLLSHIETLTKSS